MSQKKKKGKIKYPVNFEFQINNNEYLFALSMFHAIFGIPSGTSDKEPTCQSRRYKRLRFDPWVGNIPSSIFAWRIPWIEEPGGLLSIGFQRVRHNSGDLAHTTSLAKTHK